MAETKNETVLGGVTGAPEPAPNSLEMVELGRYAVEEYNKKAVCASLLTICLARA
jgi:hypothetical protein